MVDYIKKDKIAFITLNRPEAKNAIDPPTHKRLWEIWKDFEGDNSVNVAILRVKETPFVQERIQKATCPDGLMRLQKKFVRI